MRIGEKRILKQCQEAIEKVEKRLKEETVGGTVKGSKSKSKSSEVHGKKRRRDEEESNGRRNKR